MLLLGAGHCFRDQVLEVCPECVGKSDKAGSMQKTVEGSSLETIRHMVASGMGMTVLPCSAAHRSSRMDNLRSSIRSTYCFGFCPSPALSAGLPGCTSP